MTPLHAPRRPSTAPSEPRDHPALAAFDLLLVVAIAITLAALAATFGGVTPVGHLVATVAGIALATLAALRTLITGRSALSWVMLPAFAFAALAATQTVEWSFETLSILQPGSAATWSELLSEPASAGAADALRARPLSLQPGATAAQARLLLVGLALWMAAAQVCWSTRSTSALLAGVVIVTSGVVAIGILQTVSGAERIFWTFPVAGHPTGGPFVHRGHYAQFVNLGLGAGVALLFVRLAHRSPRRQNQLEDLFGGVLAPGRRVDLLLLVYAVAAVAAVGLSSARNGVISTLFAAVCLAAVVGGTRFLRGVGWPLAGMVVTAFAAVLVLGFDPVYERFAELPEEIDNADYGRLAIWGDALSMWQTYPRFGAGLGTFALTFPAFDTATRRGTVAHAENLYVELLAETGAVGAALLLCTIVGLVLVALRRLRARSAPRHAAVFGLGFGLLAVAFHQTTDFGLVTPAVAAAALVSAGAVLGLGRRVQRTGGLARGASIAVTATLAAVLSFQLPEAWGQLQRHRLTERATAARTATFDALLTDIGSETDHDRQLEWLRTAREVAANAGLAPDHETAYWTAVHTWRRAVAAALAGVDAAEDPDAARAALDAARDGPLRNAAVAASRILLDARIDAPTHGRSWSLLGELGDRWLDDADGLRWLRRGARLAPHDPTPCLALGLGLLRAGPREEAAHWLRRCIDMGRRDVDVFGLLIVEFEAEDLALTVADRDFRRLTTLETLCRRAATLLETADPDRVVRLQDIAGAARRAALATFAVESNARRLPTSWWLAAAAFRAREGDPTAARDAYRHVLGLLPQSHVARVGLGDALLQLGDHAGAILALETALRTSNDPEARLSLARARHGAGDRARALDELRAVLRARPKHAEAKRLLDDWGS